MSPDEERKFVLTLAKPVDSTIPEFIRGEVDRKLAPLAYDIDRSDTETTYSISWFAPGIRYSMFALFSEVSFGQEGEQWVLRATPDKWVIAFPFLFSAAALALFAVSGPLNSAGIAILLLLPLSVVTMAVLGALWSLRGWWRFL